MRFAPSKKISNYGWFEAEEVDFTSLSPSATWYGMQFYGNGILGNCSFIRANYRYGGGIRIYNSSPTLIGNTITDNSNHGIYVYGPNSSPFLYCNEVSDNAIYGVVFQGDAEGYLIHNTLSQPVGNYAALHATQYSEVYGYEPSPEHFGNSTIYGGDYSVEANDHSIVNLGFAYDTDIENRVLSFAAFVRAHATNYSQIYAENVWWGLDIVDQGMLNSDASSSIDYNPWLGTDPGVGTCQYSGQTHRVTIHNVEHSLLNKSMTGDISNLLLQQAHNYRMSEDYPNARQTYFTLLREYPSSPAAQRGIVELTHMAKKDSLSHIRGIINRLANTTGPLQEVASDMQLSLMQYRGNWDSTVVVGRMLENRGYNVSRIKRALMAQFRGNYNTANYPAAKLVYRRLLQHFPESVETDIAKTILTDHDLISPDTEPAPVAESPTELSIENYPNPFNPTTTLRFTLPKSTHINLTVNNIRGQVVTTLYDGFQEAGTHAFEFNGSKFASGMYWYRLQTDTKAISGRMLLMK